MKKIATNCIKDAFRSNNKSLDFLRKLTIGIIVCGMVLGILAYYVSAWIGLSEVLIGVAFVWAVRGYVLVNHDNVSILSGAVRTLAGVRNQIEIENRIKIHRIKQGGR